MISKEIIGRFIGTLANIIFIGFICAYLFFIFQAREQFSVMVLVLLIGLGVLALGIIIKSIFKEKEY
jgi:hypothetical protein